MNNTTVTTIVDCMASNENMKGIQWVQTEHRLKLVEFWGIKEGSSVLEIGCGQGDTTAVLAYIVGEKGFIHGVDIATSDYGSPITVGECANYLQQSKLGKQINMEFDVDVLSAEVDFSEGEFDYIVFSHCSWYLKSFEELEAIFKRSRKWGRKLCFAEWDARIQMIEQYPHFLAAIIQSQYECFKESSSSNIRTLFTPIDVKRIAEKSGWSITNEQAIHSPQLQDGQWEISTTIADYEEEIGNLIDLPEKLKMLIQSEVILLEEAQRNHVIKPMSVYVFSAE